MSKQIHIHMHRSSAKDAAPFRRPPFGIDDIAIGGTVIYKNGAKWEMSKAQSKSGMRVKLTNGKEIHVGDIWSTDASDWNAFKAATADARSKAEIENDLDDVQEEIEKLEDRGQTIPTALRQKREKLQAEYKAVSNAIKSDFKKAQDESKLYMTPKGTVKAGTSAEAAKLKGVHPDSVVLAGNAMIKMPERAKQYYAKDAAKYTGRETRAGVWNVFEPGKAVAVAGPFKSAEECRSWIAKQGKDANPDAQKAMMALVQGLRRLQTEAKGNQAKFKSYGDMAASDAFYRVLTQINGAVRQAESDTTRI